MRNDKVQRALNNRWLISERARWKYGTLGRVNSDGTVTVESRRQDYVYVTMDSGTQTIAYNKGNGAVDLRAGLPVKLRDDNGRLIIDGENTSGILAGDSSAPGKVYSVNGLTGYVVLTTDEITEGANLYFTDERAQDAINLMLASTATITPTYTDATPELKWDVNNASITFAKLQNIATDSLIGRDTASTGVPENITLGVSLSMNGSGVLQRAALTGDVTAPVNSNATTIANDAVSNAKLRNSGALSVIGRSANTSGDPADISATAATDAVLRESGSVLGFGTIATGGIANDAITFAKIQNVATDSLLGRDTAGSGDVENILLGASLSMDGAGNLQRAALTGDVTASANSNATTIANDAVTFAKLQNISTDSLIGRDTALSGDPENILLNATLSMDGSGNLQRAALTGDVTASAGSNATTIANNAVTTAKILDANVTLAKLANIATDSLIGRDTALSGVPENILLNATLSMDGSGNLQRAALSGDVTASAGSNVTTIANDVVTFAKMQNISTSRLLGRTTAGSGDVEEITLGTFGATLINEGTAAAARGDLLLGNLAVLDNVDTAHIVGDAVDNAKLANMANATIKGRTTAGTGDPEDLTAAQVAAIINAAVDHGLLAGLSDDDHSQYVLLAGRSGGQRVTGIASTGYALEIYRDLGSASTDSPVFRVFQDNSGDDQAALVTRSDGTGSIFEAYDGATLVLSIPDGGGITTTQGAISFTHSASVINVTRTTSSTTLIRSVAAFLANSSGTAVDGFGPGFFLQNQDATGGPTTVVQFAAVRNGGITSGDFVVYTASGGVLAEAFRATKDGNLTVVGNVTAAGLNLGNTTLSNYLESTWTPVITPGSGTFTTLTYTSQAGVHQRIGNVVYYQGAIQINAFTIGSGAGDARFSLPAITVNATNGGFPGVSWYSSAPATTTCWPIQSAQYCKILKNTLTTYLQCSDLAAGRTFWYSGWYVV